MNPELFVVFANPLPEPMVLLSGEGLVLAGNSACEHRFGISVQGWLGRPVTEIVVDPPDEVAHYLRLCRGSSQMVLGAITIRGSDEEVVCRAEGCRIRPMTKGSDALVMLKFVPKPDAAGQFVDLNIRIEELGREIQRRKHAEQDAREHAERLRTTLASIGDGIIVTDIEGRITNMNAVAESLTGWATADAMGQPLENVFRIVNEKTGLPVANPASRAMRDELIAGLAQDTLLVARDGTERPIDDSASPIRCREGQMVGCVLVFRDVSERRRLEKATQSHLFSARLLASIVESSADAILRTSLDGIIQSWNMGAERLFGYTAEQALGCHISLIIPPERVEEEERIVTSIKAGEQVEPYETVRLRCDGERIVVSLTASPVRDEAGHVIGASKIVRDVSAQRRAELRQSELITEAAAANAKFRAFFEQGALFAGVMHTDGTIIESNRLSLEACGYTREQVVGKYFWDCPWWNQSPILMEQIQTAWKQAIAGETYRSEMPYFVADGSERVVDFILLPIKDESGQVMFLAPTGTDITDQKRVEKQLAEALRFYRSSIDALSNHIAVLDENGVILEVNYAWRHFAEMNHFAGSNCGLGANYVEVCQTSSGDCAYDGEIAGGIRDVLANRKSVFEVEYPCHSPTDKRWFLMRVTRFKSPGPVRAVVSHENITPRRAAEEALRELAAELSEADRRKNEFLATLAHELRNPLAPIRTGLQLIRLAGADAASVEQARVLMDRQLNQLVRLVDDLLDVSRISTGKVELRKERVPLASVVNSAVETSRSLIEQMGHVLTVRLPRHPLIIEVDLTRLAQVLLNLLNNAAKYSERNGRIWLTAEQQGGDVVVTVKDAGIGIPADQLPHIFEMFSQVDRSLEKSQGGLGIGLSLVKRLVELHGGTIEARSEGLGKGSEFVARLPVVVESSVVQEDARTPQDDEEPALRILIVDDNRDSADSLAMMLKLMGNDTWTAYDGEEAVMAADQFRPDVILLDIGLPKLNGYETCRRIRGQVDGKKIVIIAQTGWGQDEDRQRTREAGFDYHMVKPVDPEALFSLLRSLSQNGERQLTKRGT